MKAIYNNIGDGYDDTRNADPEIVKMLAELLRLKPGGRYVDAACGTGNYTVELAKDTGTVWSAFDHSKKMLSAARAKSAAIVWDQFDVADTAYPSSSFDGAICTLAIHHFKDLRTAFCEIHRILASQGRFIIFTGLPEQMRWYWLCHYFPAMMDKSCAQMPGRDHIETALRESGFALEAVQPFWIGPELQDLFLYSGKHKPAMYLSKEIRAGISSFRTLCSAAELEHGLQKLKDDIATGVIQSVVAKYLSSVGDYAFFTATANKTPLVD